MGGVGQEEDVTGEGRALEDLLEEEDELLSYSIGDLKAEPEARWTERRELERQLEEEALGNYRVFMEGAEAVKASREGAKECAEKLREAAAGMGEARGGVEALARGSKGAQERRELARGAQAGEPAVSECLDIPGIMAMCARNGDYEDALALEACAAKLAAAGEGSALAESVRAKAEEEAGRLREELLGRLRGPAQLAESLRVVGYLRRMREGGEGGAREEFLAARGEFLDGALSEARRAPGPYERAKQVTDCLRVHLLDVATQYRAIFAEGEGRMALAHSREGPLHEWALRRVKGYARELEECLASVEDGSSLASLLENCRYCGQSLGRAGADLRALTLPAFERRAAGLFRAKLAGALDSFWLCLERVDWKAPRRSPGEEFPGAVAEHPPLAALANGVLQGLNELRLCCPEGAREACAEALKEAFDLAAGRLVQHFAGRRMGLSEQAAFRAAAEALLDACFPFLAGCLNRLYPGSAKLAWSRSAEGHLSGPSQLRSLLANLPASEH